MIKAFFTRQFLQFVMVGGLAATSNWVARYLLSDWLPFAWAVAVSYVVGLTVAFVLNSKLVFPRSQKARALQVRDFVAINVAFFPVVWLLALQINQWLIASGMNGNTEGIAHAIAIPVPMLVTFLLYKFLAFKENKHE